MFFKSIIYCLVINLLVINLGACLSKQEALHKAINENNVALVSDLISKEKQLVDLMYQDSIQLDTPLTTAIHLGNEKIVKTLLENGADANKTNGFGFTPLYLAAFKNYYSIVEILCRYGADVNLESRDGGLPLSIAAGMNHIKIVDFLILNGANINKKGNKGQTALFYASRSLDGFDSFKLLLEKGADINIRNNKGETVEDFLNNYELCSDEPKEILKQYKKSRK